MANTDALEPPQDSIVEAVKQVLHQAYPPDPPPRPLQYDGRPPRAMTENGNGNGSVGELKAKVSGLEHQFEMFQSASERQNTAINASIQSLSDKIEKRFDTIAQDQRDANTTGRSNTWVIIGIAVSSIIGLLGVGATFWTLAQNPVTTELARHDLDLREIHQTTENREELKADFQILGDGIKRNADLVASKVDQRLQDEVTKRLEQSAAYQMREHDRLESEMADTRREVASKTETMAINERVTTISNRLADFIAKFTALPKYPVVLPGSPGADQATPAAR